MDMSSGHMTVLLWFHSATQYTVFSPTGVGISQSMWKQMASEYEEWATLPVSVGRRTRLTTGSAKQVSGSVHRLLKARGAAMGLGHSMLAPLKVSEDINEVASWIKGKRSTPAYLSKQVPPHTCMLTTNTTRTCCLHCICCRTRVEIQ